jgi:FkbM family methyltransferase
LQLKNEISPTNNNRLLEVHVLLKYVSSTLRSLKRFKYDISDNRRISYSQSGEDLIIDQIFMTLGRKQITYLDLGANHPTRFSNTYLFYQRGNSGVCVEPDPLLQPLFKKWRSRDTLLTCGVGMEEGEAEFYIMTTNTLNTFSKEEAERYQGYGTQKIEKVIKLPLKPVNWMLDEYFEKSPNLISLDIEGLDFQILSNFDLAKWRPDVFCIETLTYTEDKTERKLDNIIEYMKAKDYMVYGDTYINTIFVEKDAWHKRK